MKGFKPIKTTFEKNFEKIKKIFKKPIDKRHISCIIIVTVIDIDIKTKEANKTL